MNLANLTEKAKGAIKKTPMPKKKKTMAIIAAAVTVVIVAVVLIMSFTGNEETQKILTAKVTRGDITKVIEGSGTIEAIDQYEITALVTGEILKDYFEEGQEVKQGELLYEIDTSDIENSIEKSRASLEKTQLSYEQSLETVTNLTVRAPITGTIQEVYIENGDNVSNNGKVASIINFDYMRLKINFNGNDAKNISAGQSAEVYLDSMSQAINGEVESVATGSLINESGAPVTAVEIVVANPGAIKPGDTATAIVGNYACNDAGTFEYYDSAIVSAKSTGEAYNLRVKAGDKITQGDALVYLDNSSARVNARQSELSLKDSQLALDNLIEERDEYNITAPINGKVIQKSSKAGDKLSNNDRSTTMAIIADLSSLTFEISVDELDISNIKVGQLVAVTADALENKTFTGHVENVSIVGTSSNGVTSYPVKVVMDDGIDSGLIPGMNVNARIVIDSRTDVLRVPVSAIQRGNIVYVKNGSDTAKGVMKASAAEATDSSKNEAFAPRTEAKTNMPADGESSEVKVRVGDASEGDTSENKTEGNTEGTQRRRPTGENGKSSNFQTGERPGRINTDSQNGVKAVSGTEDTARVSGGNSPRTTDGKQNAASNGDGSRANDRAEAMAKMNEQRLKSAQENAPDGFTAVAVQIGLSDENFIEIITGLSEGDEVYLPDKTASNTTRNFSGFGGMGGGMPSGMGGGMPRGMGGNTRTNATRR